MVATEAKNNFIPYNYMSDSRNIRLGLFKVPLRKPLWITETNFKSQKLPNVPPKILLDKDERKSGFENFAFTGLEFKRPIIRYQEGKAISFDWKKTETMTEHTGYSILTGNINKLVVLDLDTDKPIWNELQNEHPFIQHYSKLFGLSVNENFKISLEDIIKQIGTYSVKTQSGGFHIYFSSDDAGSYPNAQSSVLAMDIKGEGGLVIGAYTRIETVEGEYKSYTPFTDIPIISINEHKDVFEMVYTSSNVGKSRVNKSNMKKYVKEYTLNEHLYEYEISDELLAEIEEALPLSFFQDAMEYLKLTSFYKRLNKQSEWDALSKKHRGYNYDNNLQMWDSANPDINCVEYVLKCVGKLHYLPYIKYKPFIPNVIVPDTIVNSEDKKGLSECMTLDLNKNYVIKSGTATGKTHMVNQYINEEILPKTDYKLLSITSRVSLAQEHTRVFSGYRTQEDKQYYQDKLKWINEQYQQDTKKMENWKEHRMNELEEWYGLDNEFICYDNHRDEWLGLFEGDNMIIQLDSIEKIADYDFSKYIVFIDELNSVYEYLMSSSTLASRRRKVWRILNHILTSCKQFIGVDADISDQLFMWLNPEKYLSGLSPEIIDDYKQQSPNLEVEYIDNTHKHYKGTIAEEIYNYQDFVTSIGNLDKFMVCCDSATECRSLRNMILKEEHSKSLSLQEKDILVIDKLYEGSYDLDKFDRVIFSPKVVYGLDSQMRREVFCLFKGHTIPAKSMLQQVARCRNIEKLSFYFMEKTKIVKNFEFNKMDDVVKRVKYLDNYMNSYLKSQITEEEIELLDTGRQSFYNYLIGIHLYNSDSDLSNKFFHFTNGLRNIAYDVTSGMKQSLKRNGELSKQLFKETTSEIHNHFIRNLEEEYYQRINRIVKIPYKKKEECKIIGIYCQKDRLGMLNKFNEVFTTPSGLQEHLNYCELFFKNDYHTLKELKKQYGDKEFCANVSLGDMNKIKWIKDMMQKAAMEKGSLYATKELSQEEATKAKTEYLTLFRVQGNKNKIDFNDKYKLGTCLRTAIAQLVGDKEKCPYVSKPVKVKIEGKRTTRTVYEFDPLAKIQDYHSQLAKYRVSKKFKLSNTMKRLDMKTALANMKFNITMG